ncbi:MAG TPA: hypothetical protein PKA27_15665 [Fimbriimonadaceae bacterium]|nr:hypothetical protein [Fimbriimonadaceae bacterium]
MITTEWVRHHYGPAFAKLRRRTGCGVEVLADGDSVGVLLRWQTARGALGHIDLYFNEVEFGIGSAINFRRYGPVELSAVHPDPEELLDIVQTRHKGLARALVTA